MLILKITRITRRSSHFMFITEIFRLGSTSRSLWSSWPGPNPIRWVMSDSQVVVETFCIRKALTRRILPGFAKARKFTATFHGPILDQMNQFWYPKFWTSGLQNRKWEEITRSYQFREDGRMWPWGPESTMRPIRNCIWRKEHPNNVGKSEWIMWLILIFLLVHLLASSWSSSCINLLYSYHLRLSEEESISESPALTSAASLEAAIKLLGDDYIEEEGASLDREKQVCHECRSFEALATDYEDFMTDSTVSISSPIFPSSSHFTDH